MSASPKDLPGGEVNEPEGGYVSNRIVMFKSFEEADEYNYKQAAGLSPLQHLSNTLELIKMIYADELKEGSEIDNRIYFSA